MAPEYFTAFEKYLGNKSTLALLLDFDGTLSPLVSHPEDAILPAATKLILEALAEDPQIFIAIISGREVENVQRKVGLPGLTYAGSHGLNILYPDDSQYCHPVPGPILEKARFLVGQVTDECCKYGATVEDKGAVFTFHYRNVDVDKQEQLISRVKHLITEAGFKYGLAHAAIESKPPLFWDKGKASLHILNQTFGSDWPTNVAPVYIGDDVTDEDAMVSLKGVGFSFRIADSSVSQTHADVRLSTLDEVSQILQWVGHYMKTRHQN